MSNEILAYCCVFLIGILAAFTELLSRYDKPKLIFTKFPSLFYIGLNAAAAIIAYKYIDSLGIKFKINDSDNSEISKIILAGTSSLLILRSSFGIYKKGDQTLEIGVSGIVKIILNFCDRKFDQIFSEKKLKDIEGIMENGTYKVDYEKAKKDLPILCMKMMTNLSLEESVSLGSDVANLDQPDQNNNKLLFNKSKVISLGFIISKYTGTVLLKKAVESLKDDISIKAGEEQEKEKLLLEIKNARAKFIK